MIRGERVGGVGSTGDYVSVRVDHLHFDINTGKYTGGGNFTSRNTLDPELFWPDISFDYLNERSSFSGKTGSEPAITLDKYIDTHLIRFVGTENFDQWVRTNTSNITLESFKAYFEISDAQMNQLVQQYGLQDIYAEVL